MKKIALTNGRFALVDDEFFEELSKFKWYAAKNGKCYYAQRKVWSKLLGKQSIVLMHRLIMQTPNGMLTDHKNGDGLDNRKENLRVCNKKENNRNRGNPLNNTSGFKGVVLRDGKWEAQLSVDGKTLYFGRFTKKEDAASSYNEAVTIYHGEFARLNQL